MTGPPPFPNRDPGVYSRPGAASVRPAALWDAVYELAIGNVTGITPEGAQLLVDQGIAQHESKPDPHPVYVTLTEGDQRWGASSGLAPHDHLTPATGGGIDYLRTQWGADHLAAPNPHPGYTQVPDVQALIDGAITTLKAEPDPFPVYLTAGEADSLFLTPAEGDARYLPAGYTPDLSNYYTKPEAETRFLDQAEADALFLTPAEGDAAYALIQHTHPEASLALYRYSSNNAMADPGSGQLRTNTTTFSTVTAVAFDVVTDNGTDVTSKLVSLLKGDGLYLQNQSDSRNWARYTLTGPAVDQGGWFQVPVAFVGAGGAIPTNNTQLLVEATRQPNTAAYDALADRVTALEAQVATLQAQVATLNAQMGAGANGHYHNMGTWRQTAKATLPATVLEEAPAA